MMLALAWRWMPAAPSTVLGLLTVLGQGALISRWSSLAFQQGLKAFLALTSSISYAAWWRSSISHNGEKALALLPNPLFFIFFVYDIQ